MSPPAVVTRARAFWTSFGVSLLVLAALVLVVVALGPVESGGALLGLAVGLALASALVAHAWAGPWAAAGAAAAWLASLALAALAVAWVLRALGG